MKLATMMAHVGSFDSSIPKGGARPLMSPSFDFLSDPWIRFSDPPRMCWYSFLEIRGWDCGSLEMKKSHKNSHTNPTSPNAANGADNPKRDNISDGVNTNPATLPRWKPAIVIPTALDRSDWGNHLSCPRWSLKQCKCVHPDLFKAYPLCHWCLTDDLLQLNKKNWSHWGLCTRLTAYPEQLKKWERIRWEVLVNHVVHAGHCNSFSKAHKYTCGQQSRKWMLSCPRSEKSG